ncbi:CGNR zinc finger domain-containing protein [Saccharopolyspora cebuensis]|uniref:CGNR zinc finger domain-containing protein n=1 Tax=Saccharopolyspora cebuensis TaxID=418759 RepID=A0ABV4CK65_9PSEU
MGCVNSRAVAPQVDGPGVLGLDVERDVELVLAFLNTRDVDRGTDVLSDPEQWRRWCANRRIGEAPEVRTVHAYRDAMRAAVADGALSEVVVDRPWAVEVELRHGVPVLVGTDALGEVLAAATGLVRTGHWSRIKICPADDCLWAFYDRSRNRSRTWCSMRICGNREKARSWRERHTAETPAVQVAPGS